MFEVISLSCGSQKIQYYICSVVVLYKVELQKAMGGKRQLAEKWGVIPTVAALASEASIT